MSEVTVAVAYLTGYLDLALPVREGETQASIVREEQERLRKLLNIAIISQTIPRRLGPDATPEELADDKRRGKRISHVAMQCLAAWGGKPSNVDASREAAQVEWERWWQDHRPWLLARQRYIATWCFKCNGDERWAKSAIVKLGNELKWLEYALR